MASMHVLHLETGRHLYGGPRQVIELMRGLDARGVRSTLACPTGSAIATAAVAAGLEVVTHEIGGDLEIRAAEWIKANCKKPVVGFIAGETAPAGRTMGHAGAIVSGADESAAAKKKVMRECGIHVVESPATIGAKVKEVLGR